MTAKKASNDRRNTSDQMMVDEESNNKSKTTELERACPESTSSERHRFLFKYQGDVKRSIEKLKAYLDWRNRCNSHLNSTATTAAAAAINETDEADFGSNVVSDAKAWELSASTALAMSSIEEESETSASSNKSSLLPRLARFNFCQDDGNNGESLFDRDGYRIMQVLPAQLDDKLASATTYAQCVALYLDRTLDRNSIEKVTVVIDLRGGPGWANPNPASVMPFIKEVLSLLTDYFPCRLYKCLLFPLPFAALPLWKMVKVFLDSDMTKLIKVISGPAADESPVPKKMLKHMERKTMNQLENTRVSTFQGELPAKKKSRKTFFKSFH